MKRALQNQFFWLLWGAVFFIIGTGIVEPYQLPRALFMLSFALGTLLLSRKNLSSRWVIPKPFLWIGVAFIWSMISIGWAYNPVESFWNLFLYLVPVLSILVVVQYGYGTGETSKWAAYLAWTYVILVGVILMLNGIRYGWTNQDLYRIHYPAGHKSMIAAVLIGWFPFVLKTPLSRRIKQSWVLVALVLILFLQSRAAFLALIASGSILLFHQPFNWKTYRKLWVVPVMALLIWWVNPGRIRLRVHPAYILQSPTAVDRMVMWEKTYYLIREKPILGYGLGQWKLQWPALGIPANQYYADKDEEIVWTHAHNDWLETGSELGIPGMVWLFLFLAAIWYYSGFLRPAQKATTRAMVGAYLMFSLFDFPRFRIDIQWIYLSWWVWSLRSAPKSNFTIPVNKLAWTGVAGILVLMVTYGLARSIAERQVEDLWQARSANHPDEILSITGHIPKRILNLDDTSIPIDWYAGMAYLTKGKQADAMHNFKRAIKTHLNQHNAWNNMGVLYFEQNQLDSAITCFSHAKKIAPYRWAYTKNLASAYAATGQYRDALNLLDNWPDDQEEKEDLRQKIMGYLNGEITH